MVPVTLSLFVLPSRLNFDHDLGVYHSVLEWPTPLSLALLCGLVLWAVIGARRTPAASFGIAWFLLQMLPANSVVPRYDILSERNLYLASIGVFLCAVSLPCASRTEPPVPRPGSRRPRPAPSHWF